ncbi:MAG: symmetrical bis(5'-nucleosyl)-tetraphosphatase [Gammaproteobacteria bacterium]|nr:symmetrical bis(5'-nucleosyl)-tetraphosphatase [Gammaproteobacteria bacterium]
MTTYAIGDIQGCQDELEALLSQIGFNSDEDQLWFTGDLVNRGPRSLDTLRFVKSLGNRARTVLGNHDLHLLAVAYGQSQRLHRSDTLDDVLSAPDREELLHWLRHQPLLHLDPALGFCLVHAGIPPAWDLAEAQTRAAEVEAMLRSDQHTELYNKMYGEKPAQWLPKLQGWHRLRFITNALTRMRYCYPDGRLDLAQKGSPGSQPPPLKPWFELPTVRTPETRILFGHWSTLPSPDDPLATTVGIDGGCLWGGELIAVELGPQLAFHRLPCPGRQRPGG